MLGQSIFTPHHRIDTHSQGEFKRKLDHFIEQCKHKDILVDLAAVEFVDGNGLITLVKAHQQANQQTNQQTHLRYPLEKVCL